MVKVEWRDSTDSLRGVLEVVRARLKSRDDGGIKSKCHAEVMPSIATLQLQLQLQLQLGMHTILSHAQAYQ